MNATSGDPSRHYPIPRPVDGDDPRFCVGLAYDIAQVLTGYGYPPISTSGDFTHLQQTLFSYIYRQKDHTSHE
jgi:hypothetical protein